jgi:hypothetical protein
MFDADLYLVVAIFRKLRWAQDEVRIDLHQYVKRHESEIRAAGQLFIYLGLARADDESPIGWRPTNLFMDIFVRRVPIQKPYVSFNDSDGLLMCLLNDNAFSHRTKEEHRELGFTTLHNLGLIQENHSGVYRGTRELIAMFENAYYRGREAECRRRLASKAS